MRTEKDIRDAIVVLEDDRQALLDMGATQIVEHRLVSVESRLDELKWVLGEKDY